MNNKAKIILCTLLLVTITPATADDDKTKQLQKATQLYAQGVQAEKDGHFDVARTCYEGVLELQPKNGQARFRLLNLDSKKKSYSLLTQKRRLQKIVLPQLSFSDATIQEAIQGLSALIQNNKGTAGGTNFVVEDPRDLLSDKRINLSLKMIPADAALKYILGQASATAIYQDYAIVIKPLAHNVQRASNGEASANGKKQNDHIVPLGSSRSIFD